MHVKVCGSARPARLRPHVDMHVPAAAAAAAAACLCIAVSNRTGCCPLPIPRQVEFPDSRSTLCLLPAKFHKKLWIRKGSFLIVEDAPEASSEGQRVTGFVAAVLYADHVKQLRRMPGVW